VIFLTLDRFLNFQRQKEEELEENFWRYLTKEKKKHFGQKKSECFKGMTHKEVLLFLRELAVVPDRHLSTMSHTDEDALPPGQEACHAVQKK
jgi:hypothetical protein